MNIEVVCRVLLWCAVINYGILLVWFLFFMLAHDLMYQLYADGLTFQWTSLTCFTTRRCRFLR